METFKGNPKITPQTILECVSQKEIMAKYLNVHPDSVRGKFCSTLRKDHNPTCNFYWNNGKLMFRDWAWPKPLDCFGVVMEKYDVSFPESQKIVARDFNLVRNIRLGKAEKREVDIDFSYGSDKGKPKMRVKIQTFTQETIDYLTSYHISEKQCKKFNIYCPKYVWMNDSIKYIQDDNNPALAYYFGLDDNDNQKWKIYFYKNRIGTRFLTNTNRINGWIQLPEEGKHLIITKSLKDVVCIDHFDVPSIAMQAETQTPYDYIIEELERRFDNIITLFDYDDTGIRRAEEMKEIYNIPYYFIKDDNAKDLSDYIKYYGLDEAHSLIKNILWKSL